MRATFGNERGAPVNGTIPDVKKLALSDLRGWYKSFVAPSNLALIVAGPVDMRATVAAARKAFSTWNGTAAARAPVQYPPISHDSHQVIIVDRKDAVQSAIFVAQPFPSRKEPGHEARLALNDVLGGLFTSRINMNLREQHAYTYGAHSTVVSNRNFGLFAVQTSVRTNATTPALNELLAELQKVVGAPAQKPVSEAELARARADLSYRLGAHLEHNRSLATDTENIFAESLSPNYLSEAPSIYTSITLDNVAAAARQVRPTALTVVIVGDRATVESPLRKGGFTPVEPQAGWTD